MTRLRASGTSAEFILQRRDHQLSLGTTAPAKPTPQTSRVYHGPVTVYQRPRLSQQAGACTQLETPQVATLRALLANRHSNFAKSPKAQSVTMRACQLRVGAAACTFGTACRTAVRVCRRTGCIAFWTDQSGHQLALVCSVHGMLSGLATPQPHTTRGVAQAAGECVPCSASHVRRYNRKAAALPLARCALGRGAYRVRVLLMPGCPPLPHGLRNACNSDVRSSFIV